MTEAAKKSIRAKLKIIRNMSASAEGRELCDVIDELIKAIASPKQHKQECGFTPPATKESGDE
jgi:hypothetical protein